MNKRIEVFNNKGVTKSRHKNGFNFHLVESSKRRKKVMNVLVMGKGYDTRAIALKQAKAFDNDLKDPVDIYVFKTKYEWRVIQAWQI